MTHTSMEWRTGIWLHNERHHLGRPHSTSELLNWTPSSAVNSTFLLRHTLGESRWCLGGWVHTAQVRFWNWCTWRPICPAQLGVNRYCFSHFLTHLLNEKKTTKRYSNLLIMRKIQNKVRYHNSSLSLNTFQRQLDVVLEWGDSELINCRELCKLICTLEGNAY